MDQMYANSLARSAISVWMIVASSKGMYYPANNSHPLSDTPTRQY